MTAHELLCHWQSGDNLCIMFRGYSRFRLVQFPHLILPRTLWLPQKSPGLVNPWLGLNELSHCREELWMITFFPPGAQLDFKKRTEAIKPEERWYWQYREVMSCHRRSRYVRREHIHTTETWTHTHTWLTDIRVEQLKPGGKKLINTQWSVEHTVLVRCSHNKQGLFEWKLELWLCSVREQC